MFASLFVMFVNIAMALSGPLSEQGLDWLYFSIMGLLTLGVGVIGSVFTTFSTLYKAKDNELLLAMPIPPSRILLARMLIVFLMNLFFCVLVWVPAVIVHGSTGLPLVFQIILLFVLTALVTVLTCFLGWLLALITSRLNNKTFFTVLLSLLFIGLYYFLYFKMDSILKSILLNSSSFAESIKGWGYPMWQLGLAATGSVPSMIGFTLASAALFVLTCAILSRTLLNLLTAKHTGKKAVYREKREKQAGADAALLRKELRRFVSSATYLLNSGFGMLIMTAAAVFVFIKAPAAKPLLEKIESALGQIRVLPVIGALAVCFICSMDCVSAASVSLEGKQIWVLQSMPVEAERVLRAKKRVHILLNIIPAALLTAAIGVAIGADAIEIMLMILMVAAFLWFSSLFGLMMNLIKPNLEWTNEAVPIKQGMPVMFSLFGGWLICAALLVLSLVLSAVLGSKILLVICCALFALISLLMERWMKRRGAEIFRHLT